MSCHCSIGGGGELFLASTGEKIRSQIIPPANKSKTRFNFSHPGKISK